MHGYWPAGSWSAWGIGAAVLVAGAAPGWPQQTGYRISSNQVIVDNARHWRNWTYPQGTIEISADGRVQPRRRLRPTNAVADIVDFLRLHPTVPLANKKPEEISLADAIQAGSNKDGVLQALDGDPRTFWEPAWPSGQADLAAQWWFVVDLGRLVFANKIVLRFAAEGDPFLLFDVLISDGHKPARVPGSPLPEFKPALRMLQPNKSQRVFEIDLREVEKEVQAEGLRFVQVVVTGSDLDRGHEVTPEQYALLGPADRGAIDYHKRLREGQEVVVERAVYEQLPEDRRGVVRYYRRERPRLAELEVWTEGEELLTGCIARGGTMVLSAKEAANLGSFVDGDLESNSNIMIAAVQNVPDLERELFYDLGSFFWVDAHRMAYPGSGVYRSSFGSYRLDFSDGSQAVDGSLKWTTVTDREQASVYGRRFEGNRFPPIKARYFRVQYTMIIGTAAGTTKLAEIQLYGEGYQPQVSMESGLIRLGGSRNLVSVAWDTDTPRGTQVQIQTRTGNELGQLQHFYKKDGTEVTASVYKKLLSVYKGEITVEEVPGSDWSDWSEPYLEPQGSVITSPSPREYLMIRATLSSERPDVCAALRSVRLNFVDPVAQELLGEIAPMQVARLGVEQPFSLYVRPRFGTGDPGFDGLLVVAPPDMRLELVGLYGGTENQLGTGADLAGRTISGVSVVTTRPDSLHLVFPRVQRNTGIELLRLDFRTALYTAGALLQVSLQNRALGEDSWQRVDGGEATLLSESNGLTLVSTAERGRAIRDVQVRPAVFTPNGDGANDAVQFAFTVVRVGDDTPVQVEVFDLGGRLVRRLAEQRDLSAGVYAVSWDGRDQSGQMAPPGVYAARLALDSDTEGLRADDLSVVRLVYLAY